MATPPALLLSGPAAFTAFDPATRRATPGTHPAPPHPGSSRGTNGEIRERILDELPAAHMYVGRTNLSLDDVRSYNRGHAKQYRLHENDCRWVRGRAFV
jgi:hypothetical protein